MTKSVRSSDELQDPEEAEGRFASLTNDEVNLLGFCLFRVAQDGGVDEGGYELASELYNELRQENDSRNKNEESEEK